MATTNIKDFQKQLSKFVPHVKNISEDEIKKGALGVGLKGLVFKTPVDEGVARGNWNTDLNKTDMSTNESAKANDGITSGTNKIKQFKLGQTIYFTNALPYIIPLEFGHSDKAPNGMMRLTFQELVNYFKKKKGKV